jgi:formate dehydrogenase iron-sulfur subunit
MSASTLHLDSLAGERTLIDLLIDEQRSLTAVDRFSQKIESHQVPTQARYYQDLIPLTLPQPGEQYAFQVNLDQCSGCKACVAACHSLNGLDDEETWRTTGLLHGGTRATPVQQHVTTACHHCVDPACLNGCPVLAYDKDPLTGIVRHLDDQCIGCQYCVLKCPYEVPKYSNARGIVRKCDMCSQRLAVGEAPACVQACPTEAISITLVKSAGVLALHRGTAANQFLPDSPDPAYTVPTTRYVSREPLSAELQSGDAHQLRPQPAHSPLVFMLVLTQLSVGAFALEGLLGGILERTLAFAVRPMLSLVGILAALAGIGVSVAHLGRPLGAWRAFLGLGKSWLSREIVVFGLFLPLALWYGAGGQGWLPVPRALSAWLSGATILCGLAGVFCSVMIYHDTQREFWRFSTGAWKFFGSTLVLGTAAALSSVAQARQSGLAAGSVLAALAGVLVLLTMAKLALELAIFRRLDQPGRSSLQRSALLMSGPLCPVTAARFGMGVSGGILLPLVLLLETPELSLALSVAAFGLLLIGELLERRLFFTAVAPVRMPGGVAS